MKELLAVLCVIGVAAAESPSPYAPSGWRPSGPAFELPPSGQNPSYSPVDPRTPAVVPDAERDVTVQGLPPQQELQPLFQRSPISGQEYVGPNFNADIRNLDQSLNQAQVQQQKAREFARQKQESEARTPTTNAPTQFFPRTSAKPTQITQTAFTQRPVFRTSTTEANDFDLNEGETDEVGSPAVAEKQRVSVEVSKQNIQEYPPELFLNPLAQLRLQPLQFGQSPFLIPGQQSQKQVAGFDAQTHFAALPSIIAQQQLDQQRALLQQYPGNQEAFVVSGQTSNRGFLIQTPQPLQPVNGQLQPLIQPLSPIQGQNVVLQAQGVNQIQPNVDQPRKQVNDDDEQRDDSEPQQNPAQPQFVYPQPEVIYQPQQGFQQTQGFQQPQGIQQPQLVYQQPQYQPQAENAYQQQQGFQPQVSYQPQQVTFQPQAFQPQPALQPQSFQQPQAYQPQNVDQPQIYQPQTSYQPQTYQPQPQLIYNQPSDQQIYTQGQLVIPSQNFDQQLYQQQLQQQQIQGQDALQSGLDVNQQGNSIGQKEKEDEDANENDGGATATAVATAFGARTQPRVNTRYGAPVPRVQNDATTESPVEEVTTEEGPAIAEATAVVRGGKRKSAKLRSRRIRPDSPIFTLDKSGRLVFVSEQ